MKMKVLVSCLYGNAQMSKAVARALEPDNMKLPAGLQISTKVKGKKIISVVRLDGRMETLLATLDDLLSCTLTAETVLLDST